MSIGCLLAMPRAHGLFHKAILESGTGVTARPLATCIDVSEEFLKVTGVKANGIQGLRAIPVEKILLAQQELTTHVPGRVTPVAPVIDGKILPGDPLETAQTGHALRIPIIVGNNLEEMKIFYTHNQDILKLDESELVRLCQSMVPAKYVSQLIEVYRNGRARRGEPIAPHEILSAIRTDIQFRLPSIWLAEAYYKYKQTAYNFIFTWKSPAMGGILGACHTMEMGFVFGKYTDNKVYGSGRSWKLCLKRFKTHGTLSLGKEILIALALARGLSMVVSVM
jgi:para-nitrobenzyl esterase